MMFPAPGTSLREIFIIRSNVEDNCNKAQVHLHCDQFQQKDVYATGGKDAENDERQSHWSLHPDLQVAGDQWLVD